ncbi:MAG: ABC transporter substrate-binding protein [Rhodospirillaceae bacterium]
MKKSLLLTVLSALLSIAQPAFSETLRTIQTGNITALLNPFSSLIQGITNPQAMIHDMLTYVSTEGTVEPGLAISWEATSPKTWLIKLRPGVLYSNGRAFTAQIVAKNIEYLKSPAAQRYVTSGEVLTIKAARAIDTLTLEIETHSPDVLLPRRLGMIPMPEPYMYEELGSDRFGLEPIGTGSYVVKDWNLDAQRPLLVANMHSWRAPVHFDRVEMRMVKDSGTQVQALLSGQADIGFNYGIIEIDLLKKAGFRTVIRPGGQIMSLALSNLNPDSPFSDVRVRQALNYAIDTQAIADIIMMGTTRPAGQPGVETMTGYNPLVSPYSYEPRKARALLAEAGYEDGLSFRAEVLTGAAVESTTMYLKVAQDLAAIGVDMEIQPLQGSQWIRKYFSGEWEKADAISATWNGAAYWDVIRAIEIFSCKKPGVFFCEPGLMPSIDASHSMFNTDQRENALQELSQQMHDLAPSIFLIQLVDIVSVSSRLGSLVFRHKQLAVDQLSLTR